MKSLNLVYKEHSEIPYELITFSDGQVHFKLTSPKEIEYEDTVWINSRFSWNDLQVILAAYASLREAYVKDIGLHIPYFLGARSDRKFQEGGCNYIKDVIAPIINDLELSCVTVLDPHSDVVEACISNLDKDDNVDLVKWALDDLYPNPCLLTFDQPFFLVSPDAGALKKVYHLAEQIGYDHDIIVASKHRDIKTGKILSTEVKVPLVTTGKDFIIVDDICDGGRTFIEIAKEIRKQVDNAKIYLIVTHGIFSAGLTELEQYFERIYTTNSVQDIPSSFIKIKQLNIF
jgi:ribose-phosphate pyrophosphokinase